MFRRGLRAILIVAILIGGSLPADAETPLDLPAFTAVLDRLLADIAATPVENVATIRERVPSVWIVQHRGERFEVPGAEVRQELSRAGRDPSAWPDRREALLARLRATRDESRLLQDAAGAPSAADARDVLAQVLSRKEFQTNASARALALLKRRVADALVRLWERLGGHRLGAQSVTVALAWVAAISALAALSWGLVSLLLRERQRGGLGLPDPAVRRRSARAWAAQAAAAGDAREVVRCAYRAAVVRLEEVGVWRADDARTPREHLRLLGESHRWRLPFADVARRFEEVWFAARTPTTDDTRALLSRLRELECLPAD